MRRWLGRKWKKGSGPVRSEAALADSRVGLTRSAVQGTLAGRSRRFPAHIVGALLLLMIVFSCTELREPLPTGPDPVPPPPPSPFNIVGHWEATTSQGRRIAFDVNAEGWVVNGRVNFHHDCNTGRWRATLDGFTAQVVDSAFLTTWNWRAEDDGVVREGTLTVSGRFESDISMQGGFINSVNDVRTNEQPTGEVCPTIHANFEGSKES